MQFTHTEKTCWTCTTDIDNNVGVIPTPGQFALKKCNSHGKNVLWTCLKGIRSRWGEYPLLGNSHWKNAIHTKKRVVYKGYTQRVGAVPDSHMQFTRKQCVVNMCKGHTVVRYYPLLGNSRGKNVLQTCLKGINGRMGGNTRSLAIHAEKCNSHWNNVVWVRLKGIHGQFTFKKMQFTHTEKTCWTCTTDIDNNVGVIPAPGQFARNSRGKNVL